jgi:DNA gyrase/topoisomerase IV subunit B
MAEMNSDELWETTMDREKRTLLRVIISDGMNDLEQADLDAREADRIFRLLSPFSDPRVAGSPQRVDCHPRG